MSQELKLDYSEIIEPSPQLLKKWAAPRHVYFGPKDSDGQMLPEPEYSHREFPRVVYRKEIDRIRVQTIDNAEELERRLADGWVKTPADCGLITAPSIEQITEMRVKAAAIETARKEAELKDAHDAAVEFAEPVALQETKKPVGRQPKAAPVDKTATTEL